MAIGMRDYFTASFDILFFDDVDPRLKNLWNDEARTLLNPDVVEKLEEQKDKLAKLSVWHRIAAFVGLPVSMNEPNIIKNLFGWHASDAPAWQKVLNYTGIGPALTLAFNLVMMPFRFAKNILKLGLQLIPWLITVEALGLVSLIASAQNDNDNVLIKALKYTAVFLFGLVSVACTIVSGLGACLVSPVRTAQRHWQEGNIALAIFGGALSIALYAILFPLAIHFLLPIVAAQAAVYLPVLAVKALSVLSTAGTAVSAAIGAVTLGVGSTLTVLSKKFSHWYRSLKQPAMSRNPTLLDGDSDSDHDFDKNPQSTQGASLTRRLSQGNNGVSGSPRLDQLESSDEGIVVSPEQPVSQNEEARQARLRFFDKSSSGGSPDAVSDHSVGVKRKSY